jgi:hypothetical protein
MPNESYAWYELVSGSTLQQGDILLDCLEPLPPELTSAGAVDVIQHPRVVVLTQSCDLEDADVSRVMVCPVVTASELIAAAGGRERQRSTRANLERGRLTNHVLINQCLIPGHGFPHLVTDFGAAFSIPFAYATQLAATGNRVRTKPPYRERMAQAFGMFYMRVGLPLPIDPLPD